MSKRNEKMKCRQCRDNIDNYKEGKLSETDRLSFESHIVSCRECANLLKLHDLAESVINHEKNLSPGYFLTDRIMTAIENNEKKNEPVIINLFRPVLVTVSVAAAIFAGVMIGNLYQFSGDLRAPVELTFMNDIQIESIDLLSSE